ncbi:MAG TPA: TrkA C-terminal domain-containing protein [Methanomicrobiales archaeon]|nr:TrkA C-terminal domain-containing protein [Methanomicrobiales archaeon]
MSERSVELPGIGTKFELETEKGDKVAIVFMNTGRNQIYIIEKGHPVPAAAELNAREARRLGSILTGAIIEAEKEAVEIAFSALADLRIRVRTYIIPRRLSGKSIADLQIRKQTGATIVAVSRKHQNVISPPPSYTFEEGDIVVAIGEPEQLVSFESEILGT